jgi:hypothetical protein
VSGQQFTLVMGIAQVIAVAVVEDQGTGGVGGSRELKKIPARNLVFQNVKPADVRSQLGYGQVFFVKNHVWVKKCASGSGKMSNRIHFQLLLPYCERMAFADGAATPEAAVHPVKTSCENTCKEAC